MELTKKEYELLDRALDILPALHSSDISSEDCKSLQDKIREGFEDEFGYAMGDELGEISADLNERMNEGFSYNSIVSNAVYKLGYNQAVDDYLESAEDGTRPTTFTEADDSSHQFVYDQMASENCIERNKSELIKAMNLAVDPESITEDNLINIMLNADSTNYGDDLGHVYEDGYEDGWIASCNNDTNDYSDDEPSEE